MNSHGYYVILMHETQHIYAVKVEEATDTDTEIGHVMEIGADVDVINGHIRRLAHQFPTYRVTRLKS